MGATVFGRFVFLILVMLFGSGATGAKNPTVNLQLDEIGRSLNLNVASRGYLLGILTPVSQGTFWKTFEGTLMLGPHSSVGEFHDVNCLGEVQKRHLDIEICALGINPLRLSGFDTSIGHEIAGTKNIVLVRYVKYKMTAIVENRIIIKNVFVTHPELEPSGAFMVDNSLSLSKKINYARGLVTGRVVKASLDGVVRLTYEIVIQAGDGGDKYMAMSVASRELFKFIVNAMATGRILQLQYAHLFKIHSSIQHLMGYDTDFRVLNVKVL